MLYGAWIHVIKLLSGCIQRCMSESLAESFLGVGSCTNEWCNRAYFCQFFFNIYPFSCYSLSNSSCMRTPTSCNPTSSLILDCISIVRDAGVGDACELLRCLTGVLRGPPNVEYDGDLCISVCIPGATTSDQGTHT